MARHAKHVKPVANRRKPRDVIEALMLDQIELIEERWHARGFITPNEHEGLNRMYKLLTNREQADAEVDALSTLSANQGNRLDDAVTEILEGLENEN